MTSKLFVNSLEPMQGNTINVAGSGTVLHAPGHVIQVVSLENTTADSAVVSADYPVASGFKLSITPSSTNSKILVVFTIHAWLDQGSDVNKIGKKNSSFEILSQILPPLSLKYKSKKFGDTVSMFNILT